MFDAARKTGGYLPGSENLHQVWSGIPSRAGPIITEDSALCISAVFNAVEIISNGPAMMPIFAYRRLTQGKELLSGHSTNLVLHRSPNRELTPFVFKKLMISWKLLWGNARAEIVRNAQGQVVSLWPIHPSRVWTERNADGEVIHVVHNADGRTVTLEDSQVLHFRGLSKDGLNGISIIGSARQSMGMTVAAEEYGSKFFANNARPGLALKVPGNLSEPAKDRLVASVSEKVGGENLGKPMVLEEGMDLITFSMPNTDAQFMELRVHQVIEICRWFNVQPHKLKELSPSIKSNIEQQAQEFVGDTLMPHLIDFEEECDRKLFTDVEREDHFCEFLMDALLRADSVSRQESLEIQRRNGIINADGWLTKENMNVQPDGIGKFYWMPVNYTVVRPGMDRLLPVAGGNNNNEQRAKIAEAHKPLFEATIARMMRVEASAVERARKREAGIAGWAGAFYADHAVKLRAALIPCVEALGVSLRLTVDGRFTDQEWDQRIGSFTAAHVHGMIEQSRESVLQGGEPVLDAAELSRLIVSGMLELVTGVTKHENA